MKDNTRRTFVKQSAATGLTFTFAGLIRAHGAPGGGTTTVQTTAPLTTGGSTTGGSTTGTNKPLARNYGLKLYIKGNGPNGWTYTTNIAEAQPFGDDDLPQGGPTATASIPSVPTVDGKSMTLVLSQDTTTSDPLKSGYPKVTANSTQPFAAQKPNSSAFVKGFDVVVNYTWAYGADE